MKTQFRLIARGIFLILVLAVGGALVRADQYAQDSAAKQTKDVVKTARPTRAETPAPARLAPSVDRNSIEADFQKFQFSQRTRWTVSWDELSGLPRMLTGRTTRSYGTTPEAAALAFVSENRRLVGLIDERHSVRVAESKLMRKHWLVTLQQEFAGTDVYEGTIHVVIDEEGYVLHVTNSMWPASDVDFSSDIGEGVVRVSIARQFAGQDVAYSDGPRRVIYPTGTGRLAYLAYVLVGPHREAWLALVDARTGDILEEQRLIVEEKAVSRNFVPYRNSTSASEAPLNVEDACDREWIENGALVTPVPNPEDPYYVDVSMGTPGLGEYDMQMPGTYAAGIKLLPCIDYTIEVDYSVNTWGGYNAAANHMDVFFVEVDTSGWYWDHGLWPSAELVCATGYNETGAILPGTAWAAGGDQCGDGSLCSLTGSFQIPFTVPDNTKDVYLSVGMRRKSYSCPCWGTIRVKIIAQSRVFNPNPVATMNQLFADQEDANFAVPCDAYVAIDLEELTTPPAGQPWRLTGSYCAIMDIEDPATTYQSARDPDFPYLRRCDMFEAVNAYHHITQNQLYIQALGFFTVNNRVHSVDPHGFDGEDNSYYNPVPLGAGYIAYGEGGVDDAEDADVILHEYGHSIQDNQTPGTYLDRNGGTNGFGNESRSMGEGFGDYWACSYFADECLASGFDPAAFAAWDAQNLVGLRRVDKSKNYPTDMEGEEHADGEIWSRTLWDLYLAVGETTTDILILDSQFVIGAKPKFSDGAKELLAADAWENAGANENTIVNIYLDRGIFRELSVTSSHAGVPIAVSLEDVRGDQDGLANFDRVYAWGDQVTLTAPASVGGVPFSNWQVDGVNGVNGDLVAVVVMDHTPGSHIAFANYTATPPGDAVCSVTPTTIDFGNVPLGSTRDETFTIANVGNGGLVAGTVSESCGEFSIVAGDGDFSLGSGQSHDVTVRFAPTSPGTKNCTIETGTAACSDVTCTGTGVWSINPTVSTPVCTVGQEQYGPRIISDGANGVIIVWNDSRSPVWGIYAQRLDPDGVLMWAADGALVVPLVQSDALDLVSDGAGGAIVAWGTSDGDIYGQRLDAGGVPQWGASGIPLCAAAGNQGGPIGIVSDGAHGAIVTWNDWRDTQNPKIYAARVNGAGTLLWAAGGVNLGIGAAAEKGTADDGAGGAIAVGYGPAPGYPLVAQHVNASGALLWGLSGVEVAPAGALGFGSVAADGAGGVVVAFEKGVWPNHDIFAQRLNSSGGRLWSPVSGVQLCTNASTQTYPNLCSDGSGGAIVTWTDYRLTVNGPDIYARRVRGDGSVLWVADGVVISNQTRANEFREIVQDDEGGAIIAWMDNRNSLTTGQDIWAQRVNSQGQTQWTAGGRAICVASGNQITPRMARQCGCAAVIVWEDSRNVSDPDIYAQQVGCDGNLGDGDLGLNCLASGGIGNKPIRPRDEPATSDRGSLLLSVPALYDGIPNPFNPSTRIRYDVPSPGGTIAIAVYDVSGRLVRTLVEAHETPGEKSVTWDGRNNRGEDVSSGVYFCRMTLGSFSQTRKMVLLR